MTSGQDDVAERPVRVAHLTTVALSLRYLLYPQLSAVRDLPSGEVVGISAPGPEVEGLERDGIRHVALRSSTRGMNLLADLRSAWELWRILRRERVDILHTHNPKPGLYGRIVGRLARTPIVVNTNHGVYATENDRFVRRAVVLTLEAVAARFSDAELIQNPEDFNRLTRLRVNRMNRTWLLGNGIDLGRFRPGAVPDGERAARRAELGAEDDTVVVGIVGRLVVEKGYRELFEAARRLADDSPAPIKVVVIGPDDPDKADAISAEEIAAADKTGVVFLGHRDDVEAWYAAMDLFALPSYREGFPRAAMEAAASGLPIVATDVRGCRQVVDHEVTGLLVPVRDADALARAIAELAGDRPRRKTMGKAAVARAEEHFDERRVVELVMDTYRQVASWKGHEDLVDRLSPA
ncbi:MAG: glycosyltransferase family 4 protein [Acidimicrobiales bacterium]